MIRIIIEEEVPTHYAAVDLLNTIATMVKDGFTSGAYPSWHLEGDEDPEEDDIE